MYLTQDHITHYLHVSRDAGKMLIATDACGAGKTTAMLAWVAANPDWSVVMVVERKDQAETYRATLGAQGVPWQDIAVVTSDYPLERTAQVCRGAMVQQTRLSHYACATCGWTPRNCGGVRALARARSS